jgi:hypothetical protein
MHNEKMPDATNAQMQEMQNANVAKCEVLAPGLS